MSTRIQVEDLKKPLLACLHETFSKGHNIYLDKGTTLFETLDSVTAVEASQAISQNSATIAAQVEHVRFYLDVLNDYIRTKQIANVNWREIWDTVGQVTPAQWEDEKIRLKDSHSQVMATINSFGKWDGEYEIGGALAILTHTAYHLGGIRQALSAIRARKQ